MKPGAGGRTGGAGPVVQERTSASAPSSRRKRTANTCPRVHNPLPTRRPLLVILRTLLNPDWTSSFRTQACKGVGPPEWGLCIAISQRGRRRLREARGVTGFPQGTPCSPPHLRLPHSIRLGETGVGRTTRRPAPLLPTLHHRAGWWEGRPGQAKALPASRLLRHTQVFRAKSISGEGTGGYKEHEDEANTDPWEAGLALTSLPQQMQGR